MIGFSAPVLSEFRISVRLAVFGSGVLGKVQWSGMSPGSEIGILEAE